MAAVQTNDFTPCFAFFDTSGLGRGGDAADEGTPSLTKIFDAILDGIQAAGKAASSQPAAVDIIKCRFRVIRRRDIITSLVPAPAAPVKETAKGKGDKTPAAVVPAKPAKAVTVEDLFEAIEGIIADDKQAWEKLTEEKRIRALADAMKAVAEVKVTSPQQPERAASPAKSPPGSARAKTPVKSGKPSAAAKEPEIDATQNFSLPPNGNLAPESMEAMAYRSAIKFFQDLPTSGMPTHFYFLTDIPATLQEALLLLLPKDGHARCKHHPAAFGKNFGLHMMFDLQAPPSAATLLSDRPRSTSPGTARPGHTPGGATARGTSVSKAPGTGTIKSPAGKAPTSVSVAEDPPGELEKELRGMYEGPIGAELLAALQKAVCFPLDCIPLSGLPESLRCVGGPALPALAGSCLSVDRIRDTPLINLCLPPTLLGGAPQECESAILNMLEPVIRCWEKMQQYAAWLQTVSIVCIPSNHPDDAGDVQVVYKQRAAQRHEENNQDVGIVLFDMIDAITSAAGGRGASLDDEWTFKCHEFPLDPDAVVLPALPVQDDVIGATEDAHLLQQQQLHSLPAGGVRQMKVKEASALYAARVLDAYQWWTNLHQQITKEVAFSSSDTGERIANATQILALSYCPSSLADVVLQYYRSTMPSSLGGNSPKAVDPVCLPDLSKLPAPIVARLMFTSLYPKTIQIAVSKAAVESFPALPVLQGSIGMASPDSCSLVTVAGDHSSTPSGNLDLEKDEEAARNRYGAFLFGIAGEIRARSLIVKSLEEMLNRAEEINMACEVMQLRGKHPSLADVKDAPRWLFGEWSTHMELNSRGAHTAVLGLGQMRYDRIIDLIRSRMHHNFSFGGKVYAYHDVLSDCQLLAVHEPTSRSRVRRLPSHHAPTESTDTSRPCFSRWLTQMHKTDAGVKEEYVDLGTDVAWHHRGLAYEGSVFKPHLLMVQTSDQPSLDTFRIYSADHGVTLAEISKHGHALSRNHSWRTILHGSVFGMRPSKGPNAEVESTQSDNTFYACFDSSNIAQLGLAPMDDLFGKAFLSISGLPGPSKKADKHGITQWVYTLPSGLTVTLSSSGAISQCKNSPVASWPPWLRETRRHHVGARGLVVRELQPLQGNGRILHYLHADGGSSWHISSEALAFVVPSLLRRTSTLDVECNDSGLEEASALRVDVDYQGMCMATAYFQDGRPCRTWTLPVTTELNMAVDDTGVEIYTRAEFCPIMDPEWQAPKVSGPRPRVLYRKAANILKAAEEKAQIEALFSKYNLIVQGSIWTGVSADGERQAEDGIMSSHSSVIHRMRFPGGSERVIHVDGTVFDATVGGKVMVCHADYATVELDVHFEEATRAHSGVMPSGMPTTSKLASNITTGPRSRCVLVTPDCAVLGVDYDATITGTVNGRVRFHRPDGWTIAALDNGRVFARYGGILSEPVGSDAVSACLPNADILNGVEAAETARGLIPLTVPGTYEFDLWNGSVSVLDTEYNTFGIDSSGRLLADIAGALGISSQHDIVPVDSVPSWHPQPLRCRNGSHNSVSVLPRISKPAAPLLLALPGSSTSSYSHDFSCAVQLLDPVKEAALRYAGFCNTLSERCSAGARAALPRAALTMLAPAGIRLLGTVDQELLQDPADIRLSSAAFQHTTRFRYRDGTGDIGRLVEAASRTVAHLPQICWVYHKKMKRRRPTKLEVFGRAAIDSGLLSTTAMLESKVASADHENESANPLFPHQHMLLQEFWKGGISNQAAVSSLLRFLQAGCGRPDARICAHPFEQLRSENSVMWSHSTLRVARNLSKAAWVGLQAQAEEARIRYEAERKQKNVQFECVDARSIEAQNMELEMSAQIAALRAAAGVMAPTHSSGASPVAVERARKAAAHASAVKHAREVAKELLHGLFQRRGHLEMKSTIVATSEAKALVPALAGDDVLLPAVPLDAGVTLPRLVEGPQLISEFQREIHAAGERKDTTPSVPEQDLVIAGKKQSLRVSTQQRQRLAEARSHKTVLRQLAQALEHARANETVQPDSGQNETYKKQDMSNSTAGVERAADREAPVAVVVEEAGNTPDDTVTPHPDNFQTPQEGYNSSEVASLLPSPSLPAPTLTTSEADVSGGVKSGALVVHDECRTLEAGEPPAPEEVEPLDEAFVVPPLRLSHNRIDFGSVTRGDIVRRTLNIVNVTSTMTRFRVDRGHQMHRKEQNSVRVICDAGPLAGHLARTAEVELLARHPGEFTDTVTISTPESTYSLVLTAAVL